MDIFNTYSHQLFILMIFILWCAIIGTKMLFWFYIWQLKEYRRDRMRDFLHTRSGKRTIFSWIFFVEFLILIIAFIFPSHAVLYFSLLAIGEIVDWLRKRWRPKFTAKILLMMSILCVLNSIPGFIFYTNNTMFFVLVVAVMLVPILVSAFIISFEPMTHREKQRVIRRAKEKIRHVNPIVIGITGSYGKSSTKEFLKTILSEKFSVLATSKNVNVDIGVAQTILHQLKPQHEVFIAEMGAYIPGDIRSTCELVSPIIGILTAINEQHLAFFRDIETTKNTKAELLEALPSSGLAVINRDNPHCLAVADRTHAKKKFFSVQDIAHVYATDIHVFPRHIQFVLHIGNVSTPVTVRLFGAQVIPAILAAVTVADHLGLTMQQIVHGMNTLQTIPGTMDVSLGKNHATVIDDGYNANPDGFIAALRYLQVYTGKKKIVLTPGMQELGQQSDAKHEEIGRAIGAVADTLYITKKDFAQTLLRGALAGGMAREQIIIDDRPSRMIKHHLSTITDRDAVLIEGRIHGLLREYMATR
ncbi:MAG: UDP-N-acetylmuramoyl-tripeptide--D-alanyl-D-alanine ligase [Candidatus Kerfeldbacteria bacterium]|nr:UDP-N-acetylmuramoyl-tripeptide--D-alanyl-D-alanine ligase [Candidatus Kerfeldbacteria bacterium]